MIIRTGSWNLALSLCKNAKVNFIKAADIALKRQAIAAQSHIKTNIRRGPPPPHSPLTAKTGGKGRPLNRAGDLRNSVTVLPAGPLAYFIGIPRASGSYNIAEIHENGAVVIQEMTTAMRGFLHARLASAGPPPLHDSPRFVISRIPSRPFVKPAFDKVRASFMVTFQRDFAKALGGKYGGV